MRNKETHGLRHLVLVSAVRDTLRHFLQICVHMDCFHNKVLCVSSDSSLNEDSKGLAPKHYTSFKKKEEVT